MFAARLPDAPRESAGSIGPNPQSRHKALRCGNDDEKPRGELSPIALGPICQQAFSEIPSRRLGEAFTGSETASTPNLRIVAAVGSSPNRFSHNDSAAVRAVIIVMNSAGSQRAGRS